MSDKIDMVYSLLLDVHKRQGAIMEEGCPTGRRVDEKINAQDKRLSKIEGIMTKAVIAGLLVAGGGTGGGMAIVKILESLAEAQ